MRRAILLSMLALFVSLASGCVLLLPILGLNAYALSFPSGTTSQSFAIYNANPVGLPLQFSISPDQTWVSVSPVSGTSAGPGDKVEIQVSVDPAALTEGGGIANLNIATNSGRFIMRVNAAAKVAPPEEGETDNVTEGQADGEVTEGLADGESAQ